MEQPWHEIVAEIWLRLARNIIFTTTAHHNHFCDYSYIILYLQPSMMIPYWRLCLFFTGHPCYYCYIVFIFHLLHSNGKLIENI